MYTLYLSTLNIFISFVYNPLIAFLNISAPITEYSIPFCPKPRLQKVFGILGISSIIGKESLVFATVELNANSIGISSMLYNVFCRLLYNFLTAIYNSVIRCKSKYM